MQGSIFIGRSLPIVNWVQDKLNVETMKDSRFSQKFELGTWPLLLLLSTGPH